MTAVLPAELAVSPPPGAPRNPSHTALKLGAERDTPPGQPANRLFMAVGRAGGEGQLSAISLVGQYFPSGAVRTEGKPGSPGSLIR